MHQFVVRSPTICGLFDAREHVLAGEARVEIVESVRSVDADERDARAVPVGMREHAPAVPLGHEGERVGVGMLDPGALDVRIEVVDVDELGAAVVGGRRRRHAPTLPGRARR